jgi:hypothetical protein
MGRGHKGIRSTEETGTGRICSNVAGSYSVGARADKCGCNSLALAGRGQDEMMTRRKFTALLSGAAATAARR